MNYYQVLHYCLRVSDYECAKQVSNKQIVRYAQPHHVFLEIIPTSYIFRIRSKQ